VAAKAAVANPDKAAAIKVYLTTLDKAYVWAAAHRRPGHGLGQGRRAADVHHGRGREDRRHHSAQITSATVSAEQGLVNQFYAAGLIPNKVNISDYITRNSTPRWAGSR